MPTRNVCNVLRKIAADQQVTDADVKKKRVEMQGKKNPPKKSDSEQVAQVTDKDVNKLRAKRSSNAASVRDQTVDMQGSAPKRAVSEMLARRALQGKQTYNSVFTPGNAEKSQAALDNNTINELIKLLKEYGPYAGGGAAIGGTIGSMVSPNNRLRNAILGLVLGAGVGVGGKAVANKVLA